MERGGKRIVSLILFLVTKQDDIWGTHTHTEGVISNTVIEKGPQGFTNCKFGNRQIQRWGG